MYNIKTLNKISKTGLALFDCDKYAIDTENEPDAILVRSADMLSEQFGKKLRCIARAGAGTNNIPSERCAGEGICVFNTPGANANAVKEMVICALLLSCRNIEGGMKWVQGIDKNEDIAALVEKGKSAFTGPEIAGKTLGVVGLGAIGALVCEAALALGMKVIGYDPFLSVEAAWQLPPTVQCAKELSTIYAKCDFISLHVPQNASTKGMIDDAAFAAMKDGVRIINIARGGLVDNNALFKAIDAGKVACYVTDFPDSDLTGHDKVVCIPHLGASTPESEENCARMAVLQTADFLENGNIKNSVNMPAVRLDKSAPHRMSAVFRADEITAADICAKLTAAGARVAAFAGGERKGIGYAIFDVDTLVEAGDIKGVIRITNIY